MIRDLPCGCSYGQGLYTPCEWHKIDSNNKGAQQMTHTLVVIGDLGIKRAYLDITESDALERFLKTENISENDEEQVAYYRATTRSFEFESEFSVYDAWR